MELAKLDKYFNERICVEFWRKNNTTIHTHDLSIKTFL